MALINCFIPASKRLFMIAISSLMMIAINTHAEYEEEPSDLLQQVHSLQVRMNIQITGLENIEPEEDKVMATGSLEQQIEQVLASYNLIISRNAKKQIAHIVIIDKKPNPDDHSEDQRIVLPTSRKGNHFLVPVAISGNGSQWQTLDMIIDTGADLVVLPESLIKQLGFAENSLSQRKMQTANGTTIAKTGTLQKLEIAGETVENVAAAFIPDELLGKHSLLGMSFLGRYQINIDDKTQLFTLIKN